MRIAAASDIHGFWDVIKYQQGYPKADVLVLAGDILADHSYDHKLCGQEQLEELISFDHFMGELIDDGIYKHVLYVAGNHEFAFYYHNDEARKRCERVTYLQDSGVTIDGVHFYGSPWQPWFGDWAFNFPRPPYHLPMGEIEDSSAVRKIRGTWASIPAKTNVLITHTPPRGVLDVTLSGKSAGCQYLRRRLDRLARKRNLKQHFFGHIHYSHGQKAVDYDCRVGHQRFKHTVGHNNVAVCRGHDDPANSINTYDI